MKRLLPLLALCSLSLADAHDLARDGAVGGLLHLAPDDAPVAGRATDVFVDLRQPGGKAVTLAQCVCTLSVAGPKGTRTISLRDVAGHLSATLIFADVGAYTLSLNGHVNAQPFVLHWVVRAAGK